MNWNGNKKEEKIKLNYGDDARQREREREREEWEHDVVTRKIRKSWGQEEGMKFLNHLPCFSDN